MMVLRMVDLPELDEELNLTENIGYFLVERDHVLAPEHPAVADFQEIREHLREDGVSVVFKFVVQAAESTVDSHFFNWESGAIVFAIIMNSTHPLCFAAAQFSLKGDIAVCAHYSFFQDIRLIIIVIFHIQFALLA